MIFHKISNFFKNNKKIFYYFWFFVVVYMMSGEIGFATTEWVKEAVQSAWAQKWVDWLNWTLMVASSIVWAFTYFVTLFLEPGWINWSLFWLHIKFREIWILVSNVVYFIFAWILIWIAFMNIIGKWEKWELKQSLPKFIIWVLIVPFSWFFVQFILSISALLTVSALSLPYDTFTDYKIRMDWVLIPNDCTINLSYSPDAKDSTLWDSQSTSKNDWYFTCKDTTQKLWDSLKKTPFWLISIYTYWILNLDKIDDISKEEITTKNVKNVFDLIIKIVFNFLFVIIYVILFIALWIVLAVRWMYLWIYTMLSPIFWLMYFFDKNEWWWEWVFAKFNIKEFISLALVPVYVMLALSFWMLFIFVVISWTTSDINWWGFKIEAWSWSEAWSDKMTIWSVDWSGFKLTMKWPVGWLDPAQNVANALVWAKNVTLGVIWTLILNLMWVVVLRVSIMAALRSSDITKAVVQPIYDFGNQVWSLVAKSPQYAPIFPGGQSMKSMSSIAWQVSSSIESRQTTKASDFINKHTPFGSNDIEKLERLKNNINWYWSDIRKINPEIQNIIKAAWSFEQVKSLRSAREWIFAALKWVFDDVKLKELNIESESDLNNNDKLLNAFKALDENEKLIEQIYSMNISEKLIKIQSIILLKNDDQQFNLMIKKKLNLMLFEIILYLIYHDHIEGLHE